MSLQPVLINGEWRESNLNGTFRSENPAKREPLPEEYPVSAWEDCEAAIQAAASAFSALRNAEPDLLAEFLEGFAKRIEKRADELAEMAHAETALPKSPRLKDVELPRTTGQLRQAASAAREGSWALPTIDTQANIRSILVPLGPVCVFGPNNFPFAFGSISGGDFAAAIAAGNPVIAKGNSSHPGTTRLFAEAAVEAAREVSLPPGTIQLLYRTNHDDGMKLVADPRIGATGYTGSRNAGLKLKAAADAAGKPIYLELSSVNPVVILPGALAERNDRIAEEFSTSCLMGAGQFCTNPGIVVLVAGAETEEFVKNIRDRFEKAPSGTLLSSQVAVSLDKSIRTLQAAGAELVTGGVPRNGEGYCFANTLLRISGESFLKAAEALQTEAFGNASLLVVSSDVEQAVEVIRNLEGNLTGCIYSHSSGDDAVYRVIADALCPKVGRLLNDKMPTGVAVSPAMNHGGPFPATGHPGFTAVGIPASLRRFAALRCYDNVRHERLPALLRDQNPTGSTWRFIDGRWSQADVVKSKG